MPTLRNADGQDFEVSDVDAVKMSTQDPSLKILGDVRTSPEDSGTAPVSMAGTTVATQEGHAPATAAEQGAFSHREYLKGKTSAVGTVLRGGASGLSFGQSDKLFDPETIEADEAVNGGLRTASSIAGAVAPAFLGDVAGLAGLGKTAALADDALSTERAASSLSSKFLFGGEVGRDAALEKGLARGRTALESSATAADVTRAAPELAGLDLKGLDAAHGAEVDRLVQSQVADRASAVTAAGEYRAALKEANPWLVIDEGEDAARLNKGNRAIRGALDDTAGLAKNPSSLLKPLRQQEKSLQAALDGREAIVEKFTAANEKLAGGLEEELSTLPDAATHVEISGKLAKRYGQFADVKVGKGAVRVAREDASQFLDALRGGELQGEGAAALDKIPGLLEQNRGLQAKIEASLAPKAELTSDRLAAIKDAKSALMTPAAPKSLPQQMLEGHVFGAVTALASPLGHFAPVIGAKASKLIGDVVFGHMGGAITGAGERATSAVSSFLSGAMRNPFVPVLATKALANAAFAPREAPAGGKQSGKQSLTALFKARTDEIKSQTAYDATGTPRLKPEARQAMADQLKALRVIDPILADRIETIATRRIEYLSSIIPRHPDYGVPMGPDLWQPGDMEMRAFARRVAAAEDPHGVLERAAHGAVSPEDAEALRAVAPEELANFTREVAMQLTTLKKPLPYARRLALSILTGQPMDPSMHPAVLAVLQGHFENEEGSEGGTQAPTPQPAFGSVRADIGTASQQREGAMR